jgi:hypothetical protein
LGPGGWLAGLRQMGCGQVGSSPFFQFLSFLLFPFFCFAISNTSLLFDSAGFELAIHLQGFEFEITYQICRRHF